MALAGFLLSSKCLDEDLTLKILRAVGDAKDLPLPVVYIYPTLLHMVLPTTPIRTRNG
jgi:hypothetical protein